MGLWSDWYEKHAGKDGSLTSAEFVLKKIDESIKKMWPVGSIYMSVNNTNPSIYFPGTTWSAWGSGRVPVGVNAGDTDFGTVEKTGGEKTSTNTSSGGGTSGEVAITVAQIPSHSHSLSKDKVLLEDKTWSLAFRKMNYDNDVVGYDASVLSYIGSTGIVFSREIYSNVPFDGVEISNVTRTARHIATHTHSHRAKEGAKVETTGSGDSHSHSTPSHQHTVSTLQPYITCYMWKRTT